MPESPRGMALDHPYHKDRFTYDAGNDTYRCPQGQVLSLVRGRFAKRTNKRMYQAPKCVCQACPVAGECITRGSASRSLAISPHDAALRRHRAWMATDEARSAFKKRKQLVEPVFGIIKEQQGLRRFLLRGLANVAAEWDLAGHRLQPPDSVARMAYPAAGLPRASGGKPCSSDSRQHDCKPIVLPALPLTPAPTPATELATNSVSAKPFGVFVRQPLQLRKRAANRRLALIPSNQTPCLFEVGDDVFGEALQGVHDYLARDG